MRVLVIGGTGFIGPFVVERLSRLGHHVAVYHRGEHEARLPFGVEHFHSPLAEPPVVRFPPETTSLAWDVVLAMAPIGARDAEALMRTFRGIARRVVALSSGDVYRAYGILRGTEKTEAGGEGAIDSSPLTEDAPLRVSRHPYRDPPVPGLPEYLRESEKIEVECAVRGDPDLPGTVLRLPAVYGPGDRQGRFADVLRRIDGGSGVVLGESYAGWRWTHGYVEDVAEAVVLAVVRERARGRVYNVGEEPTPTMAERAEAFARAAGWTGEIVIRPDAEAPPPSPGRFEQPLVYDTTRIRRELDWTETIPVVEAWRRTVSWERRRGAEGEDPESEIGNRETKRREPA